MVAALCGGLEKGQLSRDFDQIGEVFKPDPLKKRKRKDKRRERSDRKEDQKNQKLKESEALTKEE